MTSEHFDAGLPSESTPGEITVTDIFDGSQFGPQFAIALRNFLLRNMGILVTGGYSSITTNGSQQTFAHGLGVVPTFYGLTPQIYTAGTSPVTNMALLAFDPSKQPDATYFYLKGVGEGATINFAWFAVFIPSP